MYLDYIVQPEKDRLVYTQKLILASKNAFSRKPQTKVALIFN